MLSSGFTLAVTVGGIIGLGILRTPGEVAAVVSDPLMFVLLWLLGGLFILLSAATAAELVGMTPRSGGTYVLMRRAYGSFPGFVIGWVDWLSFVGDIALKAVVVTEFIALLIPEADQWRTPLAITVSSVFAAMQLRGIALGAESFGTANTTNRPRTVSDHPYGAKLLFTARKHSQAELANSLGCSNRPS
jgi:APA family basic amino acid/polyamine antiporter